METGDPQATDEVLLTERTGHVLVLTLNRPQARNALNPELKDAILAATAAADHDPDVRAVVITGNGPVFCAGMDLKAFAGGAAFGADADETAAIFRSADALEGARAFAERRPPAWTGQ